MRLVLDTEGRHAVRWQAVKSIAAKIGCTAKTLSDWVEKAEVDGGRRARVPTEMAEKMKLGLAAWPTGASGATRPLQVLRV